MFGVIQIDFVQAGNTEKSYLQSHSLTGVRQQREIIKGLEQVGDTIPPKVEIYRSLQGVLSSLPKSPAVKLVASTEPPTETLMAWEREISEGRPTIIAIGPELGWQAAELNLFDEEGFSPLTLGNRVLRVEVALAAFLGQLELLRTPRA